MVLHIADILLRIAKQKDQSITPMKLIKLVYIANGWSLALNDISLFNDKIEAWKYGPVIPELYQSTKKYGKNPIPFDKIADDFDDINEGLVSFLQLVYDIYEDKTGIDLSALTHRVGTPWHDVYDFNMNEEIPQELIRQHYLRMLEDVTKQEDHFRAAS